MANTPRHKPGSSGPGRGTPRARTAARPGERAPTRTRAKAVEPAPDTKPSAPPPRKPSALGVTWRLIAVAVVVAVVAVTLAQSLRVYFAQTAELADLRTEIQARHDEIAHLEDELKRWEDPEFVKVQARERLGWVLPGETGYRVIGADGTPLGGDDALLRPEEKPGGAWYERMWGSVQAADRPVEDEEDAQSAPTSPPPTLIPAPSPTPTR